MPAIRNNLFYNFIKWYGNTPGSPVCTTNSIQNAGPVYAQQIYKIVDVAELAVAGIHHVDPNAFGNTLFYCLFRNMLIKYKTVIIANAVLTFLIANFCAKNTINKLQTVIPIVKTVNPFTISKSWYAKI